MNNKLTLKSLLAFIDNLDLKGKWIIPSKAFRVVFDEKDNTLYKKLNFFVDSGVLMYLTKGFYANKRARSKSAFFLEEMAKYFRPEDLFYESLESGASELSLISQIPNRLTLVTDGRSYSYDTPLGIIEFTHRKLDYEKFQKLIEENLIVYDNEKKIYCAEKDLVKKDLIRSGRAVDLMYEQEEDSNYANL
ncbi:MAG: hypothetical protein ACYCTB_01815 [bacterium]